MQITASADAGEDLLAYRNGRGWHDVRAEDPLGPDARPADRTALVHAVELDATLEPRLADALGGLGVCNYVTNKCSDPADFPGIGAQLWIQFQGVLTAVVLSADVSNVRDVFVAGVARKRDHKLVADVASALSWLERYDVWFILSFRFLYGIRNVASVAIGLSPMGWSKFAFWNFLAAALWSASFVAGGYFLGALLGPKGVAIALGCVVLAAVGGVLIRHWWKRGTAASPPRQGTSPGA